MQIDELPQLWNIYLWDMNFIWPRALTPNDIERIGRNNIHHDRRWNMKPGITWFWQFVYECDAKITLLYDQYYYHNQWIVIDIYILLMTIISCIIWRIKTKKIFYLLNKKIVWI